MRRVVSLFAGDNGRPTTPRKRVVVTSSSVPRTHARIHPHPHTHAHIRTQYTCTLHDVIGMCSGYVQGVSLHTVYETLRNMVHALCYQLEESVFSKNFEFSLLKTFFSCVYIL